LVSVPSDFLFPFLLVCVFLSCLYCSGLLLAISMVKSSCCFWNCSKNSVCRWVLVNTFTHCRELMKSVGKLWEVKSLSHIQLLMVLEQV
jgi:hypothetical protein